MTHGQWLMGWLASQNQRKIKLESGEAEERCACRPLATGRVGEGTGVRVDASRGHPCGGGCLNPLGAVLCWMVSLSLFPEPQGFLMGTPYKETSGMEPVWAQQCGFPLTQADLASATSECLAC